MAVQKHSILDTRYFPLGFYILLTLAGCIFIAATKAAGANPFLSMVVPIGIMIAYLAVSWWIGKLRTHDEQTGDNLYYMGFLFTLSSLGASLYQFGAGGSIDDIVRNFGIAVSSTITGIALRIFYNQVRRDPADIERSTRFELADMARRVRMEMESVAREFADFRRVCNQMLEEGFEEIARQAERNGEQVRAAFDSMAGKASQPVQESSEKIARALDDTFGRIENRFSGVADKVESVASSLDKANVLMAATVTKFEKQADTVAEKLSKVIIPDEVLKTDVVTVLKILASTVGKFTERAEALSAEQASRTDKLSETMLKMTAFQKTALDRMDKRAEEEVSTRQLMVEFLKSSEKAAAERASGPTSPIAAPVALDDEPHVFTSSVFPTSPRGSAREAGPTLSPQSTPQGPETAPPPVHPVETSEPIAEKVRRGWFR